jgi:hypothetical protein
MHANYIKQMNIWKFLTPLDSTHLEVFLRILWDFFIFWIQIQILNLDRLETGQNRSGPVGPVPTVSGPVPTGSVNPGCGVSLYQSERVHAWDSKNTLIIFKNHHKNNKSKKYYKINSIGIQVLLCWLNIMLIIFKNHKNKNKKYELS